MSLQSLGYAPFFAEQLDLLARPDLVPARVLSEGPNTYHLGGSEAPLGELSGALRHELGPLGRPVVGDWLAVADGPRRAIVHEILERQSAMVRRAAGSAAGSQVIAANVDVFFVVTSANRDFNLRRIERYLTAVWDSGARPVVVLNKVDLGGDVDAKIEAIQSIGFGLPVARASAATGEGLDELRAHISPGVTIGLVGSSGVGKSSIINCLLGRAAQEVRGLRGDEKGRHTTTRRELIELPDGGLLIDTPGMRELGLIEDSGGVDTTFTDIAAHADRCRFGDCGHAGEPGCAVEAAVVAGELPPERLASYQKLQREIAAAERRRDPLHAGRPKRRWKFIHQAMRARSKVDPKFEK